MRKIQNQKSQFYSLAGVSGLMYKKRGLPSWMLEEHENAKKKKEETLKKRKDAHLKNVTISEKVDKKAEKLHTKTLPYPYTSKEVFEQSIRIPIGPEFNPATAIGALNRPEVVKKSCVIIKPIQYEDVDPHGMWIPMGEQRSISGVGRSRRVGIDGRARIEAECQKD